MLKSCSYCGRIHDSKNWCKQKRDAEQRRWKNRKSKRAVDFRNSNAWKNKREDVKRRHNYMCVCCAHNLKGTLDVLNTEDLSVHHITPIEEDYGLRLDDTNLITVCGMHHEMCEAGKIGREVQRQLAEEYLEDMPTLIL